MNAVQRHCSHADDLHFWCITDSGVRFATNIPALDPLCSYWDKLQLFAPQVFPRGSRAVYFDLDVLIRGSVDSLIDRDEPFVMLRDGIYPHRWNSSVMAWTVTPRTEGIWHEWIRAGRPLSRALPDSKGDQAWIEKYLRSYGPVPALWQDVTPGVVAPFYGPGLDATKPECWTRLEDPGEAAVVVFHGRPRLHENELPWVKTAWI